MELFGRLVLIGIGVFIAFVAVRPWLKLPKGPTIKPPNVRVIFLMLAFAGLFLGLGTFGQEFIPHYASWLGTVRGMVSSPGQKSYAAFFDSVGKEKIPVELQEIGINYAVSHPIEGMETILNNSINKAPKNTNGEKALQWALESYKGKQKETDYLIETKGGAASVGQFDPATRQLIYDKMQRLPDDRKRVLRIDDKSLEEHRAILRPFPKRPDR